jgi:hypothetical protein
VDVAIGLDLKVHPSPFTGTLILYGMSTDVIVTLFVARDLAPFGQKSKTPPCPSARTDQPPRRQHLPRYPNTPLYAGTRATLKDFRESVSFLLTGSERRVKLRLQDWIVRLNRGFYGKRGDT